MENREKFARLKQIAHLKSAYHKKQISLAAKDLRTQLDSKDLVSNLTKITTGAIGLYNTVSTSSNEDQS